MAIAHWQLRQTQQHQSPNKYLTTNNPNTMPQQNALIKTSTQSLQKINTALAIMDKLLLDDYETKQQKVKAFLIKYADRADFTAQILSRYYPLSEPLIRKYSYKWKSGNISENESLPWSIELIKNYNLHYSSLEENKSLP
jgi:hypothetical protein